MLAKFVVDSHSRSQPKGANIDDNYASHPENLLASAREADPEVVFDLQKIIFDLYKGASI